ncbi:MAG: response regulator [Bacteroidales bacterium]|nr:response regulator [Bacteroidales bacterium]
MDIFIVDDNEKFRVNLKLYLEGSLHHKVVGEASNGKEFIDSNSFSYDIILMDIEMPEMNGIEAAKSETRRVNNQNIIAISQHNEMINLKGLIEAGFKGFVSKVNLYDQLGDAIREVSNGGYYFP